jgi:uncharacterized protein YkwD
MKLFFSFFLLMIAHAGAYSQGGKTISDDKEFITAILRQHNSLRSALHLPDLQWSSSLAKDALEWAQRLARDNKGHHDPRLIKLNEGENLWWGTADAFSYADMVSYWGNEQKDFVYGVFPDCQSSPSAVVGHYTQIVWKNTTSVGCAVASNGKTDFLVCRYSPAGNVEGEKPY